MNCPRCKDFGRKVRMVRKPFQEFIRDKLVTVWYWVCPACGYTGGKA